MNAGEAFALGLGIGAVLAAPLAAPLGIWLYERHLARVGLKEWSRRVR